MRKAEEEEKEKIKRVLGIYTKLMNGHLINKCEEAQTYGVSERTIQRDLADIQKYFDDEIVNSGCVNSVSYDRKKKKHYVEQVYETKLSNSEVLAVCKILLDSRAFTKPEMESILDKLLACCVPEINQKLVVELIRNEEFHYVEPRHKTVFKDKMWEIGQAIKDHKYIEIDYARTTKKAAEKHNVKRKLKPVAIMFSEFYFYLAAFIDDEEVRKGFEVADDPYPTIYRMDRIKKLKVLQENFSIPHSGRFEEGEFRKRVQFMYGGKLQKVKFKYLGNDIDAVLDRLPTAKATKTEDGNFVVEAEVFGKGIGMWFRSQGENVERM